MPHGSLDYDYDYIDMSNIKSSEKQDPQPGLT